MRSFGTKEKVTMAKFFHNALKIDFFWETEYRIPSILVLPIVEFQARFKLFYLS